jgi:hypothetical protein
MNCESPSGCLHGRQSLWLLARELLVAVAVLALAPGLPWAASLTGTWQGRGEEKVCGNTAIRPVEVTLRLTQVAETRDAFSPIANDPLIEANQNIKGDFEITGSLQGSAEGGNFVAALDNRGNLNGRVFRTHGPGQPPLSGVTTLLDWVFDVKMTASGGLFSYKKLSGTFSRPWQCRAVPGSSRTEPNLDVITVELTRQR